MTELPAAVITAVSLILCANVYVALWRRLGLSVDVRRAVKYWRVAWRQKTDAERSEAKLNAGMWAAVVLLLADVLILAAR